MADDFSAFYEGVPSADADAAPGHGGAHSEEAVAPAGGDDDAAPLADAVAAPDFADVYDRLDDACNELSTDRVRRRDGEMVDVRRSEWPRLPPCERAVGSLCVVILGGQAHEEAERFRVRAEQAERQLAEKSAKVCACSTLVFTWPVRCRRVLTSLKPALTLRWTVIVRVLLSAAQAERLSKQSAVLVRNLSVLFRTAQMEIARKDAMIAELRKE